MRFEKVINRNNPFGALIGILSLIGAILFVAGFAYRWSYYYNFGVQHIVFNFNFKSFLITAFELAREPKNLLLSFIYIICPLVVINYLIKVIILSSNSDQQNFISKIAVLLLKILGLKSPLVVDLIKIALLIYTTYMLSSYIGYNTYKDHIINSPDNPLPSISVLFENEDNETELVLSCGARNYRTAQVIGDAAKIRTIQITNQTCNTDTTTWRLLYRDNEFIYIFASEPKDIIENRRPLTIILPNNANTYLIMD